MDKPNYVLNTNEGILMKKKSDKNPMRTVVLVIIGILLFFSYLFNDNLFLELNWASRIMLIALACKFLFFNGSERVPSAIEIRFYDDYMVVYRPSRYYNKRVTRREFTTIYYSDITKCVFVPNLKKVKIYADLRWVFYNYNKDGTLPSEPNYDRFLENNMSIFYLVDNCEETIKEIEEHANVKFVLDDF